MSHSQNSAPGWAVLAALMAVYILWGSTYLAIRWGIETIPPLLMAGTRFLVAGGVLYAWVRLRGVPRPEPLHWGPAAGIGVLMLFGGNGGVTLGERWVPSGVAALLVATVPLWMVVLDWLRPGGTRPRVLVVLGLLTGFGGVGILIGPARLGGAPVHPVGATLVLVASLSWAIGSLWSRHARLPSSPLLATAMEMMSGGLACIVVGLTLGEGGQLDLAGVSLRSVLSLGWLIVAGSLVAFSCYIWLLRVSTPAIVSTYAFVNPVVAVLLGWALASEALSPRTWLATAVIVASVALITARRSRRAMTRAAASARTGPVAGAETP